MSNFKILFKLNIECSCMSIKLDYNIAIKKTYTLTHPNRHTTKSNFILLFLAALNCPCRANGKKMRQIGKRKTIIHHTNQWQNLLRQHLCDAFELIIWMTQ